MLPYNTWVELYSNNLIGSGISLSQTITNDCVGESYCHGAACYKISGDFDNVEVGFANIQT